MKGFPVVLSAAVVLLFAVVIPAISSSGIPRAHADGPAITQSDLKIAVQPMAPTLPADIGKYFMSIQLQTAKDSVPIEAMKDTPVNLTVSDSSILQIPSQVIIPQGQTYVNAYFNTTGKIGTVQVNALTPNTAAGSASISTIQVNTLQPSKLVIFGGPSKSVPDPRFVGKVYIQLLNAQNLPARAQSTVVVTLSSSDPQIVQVPSFAYINPGNSGTVVTFTPGYESGTVQITASAPGLTPSTTQIVTTGLVATKIFVDYGPKIIPAMTGPSGEIIVQLRDASGFPVKAYQTTRIFLKSSTTSVATLPDYVDILPGQSYGIVTLTGGGVAGSTQITASSPNLQTGTVDVLIVSTTGQTARSLYVFAVPDVLPPDSTQSPTLFYVYTDGNSNVAPYNLTSVVGSPVATSFAGNIGPTITSSNLQVGNIAGGILLQPYYAVTSFKTTFRAGDSYVTLSQNGLRSWQDKVTTMGPQPTALSVSQVPSVIQADGGSYQAVMVSLLDSSGNAVPASQDTIVYLTSSAPAIMTTDASVAIPAGQSYAIASITTTTVPGASTITASANGLTSSSTNFATAGFTSPYTLGIYATPSTVPSDGMPHRNIVVQLHDLLGNPTPAPANIAVALSSSSLTAANVQETVVIPAGSTFAVANSTGNLVTPALQSTVQAFQTLQVTASAQGFQSVSTTVNVGSQTMEVAVPNISVGFTRNSIPVDVYTSSFPLSGATVTVSGVHADTVKALTNAAGHAEGVYSPTQPGDNTVVVTITKPGYLPFMQSTDVSIKQKIDLVVNAATQHAHALSATIAVLPPVGQLITKKTDPNTPVEIKSGDFGSYTITAPKSFEDASGKYNFVAWSDGIMDDPRTTNIYVDTNLTAIYSAQYYLDITTAHGTSIGNGWYPEGANVSVSVSPTTISSIISDTNFAGWSGDIQSDSITTIVQMDGPKSIVAVWHDNYLKAIIMAALAGSGGGGFFYVKRIRVKKQKKETEEETSPDLDWFKR